MLREKKERIVAELAERLGKARTLMVADYRGLTMAEIDILRSELLKHGARFSVCKNTLTKRAAEIAGVTALDDFLVGPTAIAFVIDGDIVGVAKTLNETARSTRRLSLKGALLDGTAVGEEAVRELTTLPPTDVLRGQVLGAIIGPLSTLFGLVSAPVVNLVGLFEARIVQLEQQEA